MHIIKLTNRFQNFSPGTHQLRLLSAVCELPCCSTSSPTSKVISVRITKFCHNNQQPQKSQWPDSKVYFSFMLQVQCVPAVKFSIVTQGLGCGDPILTCCCEAGKRATSSRFCTEVTHPFCLHLFGQSKSCDHI